MSALSKRISRLEAATPDGPRPALVLVGAAGVDPDSLVGVDGLEDHPRLAGEAVGDYIARLESIIRADRVRALPFVGFARYGTDDEPDAPPEQDTAALS